MGSEQTYWTLSGKSEILDTTCILALSRKYCFSINYQYKLFETN